MVYMLVSDCFGLHAIIRTISFSWRFSTRSKTLLCDELPLVHQDSHHCFALGMQSCKAKRGTLTLGQYLTRAKVDKRVVLNGGQNAGFLLSRFTVEWCYVDR